MLPDVLGGETRGAAEQRKGARMTPDSITGRRWLMPAVFLAWRLIMSGPAVAQDVQAGGLLLTHQQDVGMGALQNIEDLIAPVSVLDEVVNDQVGAKAQVFAPASVETSQ